MPDIEPLGQGIPFRDRASRIFESSAEDVDNAVGDDPPSLLPILCRRHGIHSLMAPPKSHDLGSRADRGLSVRCLARVHGLLA